MWQEGDSIHWWNHGIEIAEFSDLLTEFFGHKAKYPVDGHGTYGQLTQYIEELGKTLVRNSFPEGAIRIFIQNVCRWGNYPGIAARVINENDAAHIAQQFRQSYNQITQGNAVSALTTLMRLGGLGGESFASKHLKFLAPAKAVVLDSVIEDRLGYRRNIAGYGNFVIDCRHILHQLINHKVCYPGWEPAGWRISDVEMAIFESLND